MIGVRFERHDPVADEKALRKLALACHRFSPLVAIEETAQPECLLLDVTGCGPFFGGEVKLAARVVRGLHGSSIRCRVAIADTVGAAWAGARFGAASPLVMPPRRHAELLEPMPIEALRLPADVVRTLHAFDLRTIGQLPGVAEGRSCRPGSDRC